MASSKILVGLASLVIFLTVIQSTYGIKCYTCSTFENQDACKEPESKVCEDDEDVCLKIVTEYQRPHNKPVSPTEDNTKKTDKYVTKLCGDKEGFKHFTDVDECAFDSIGGGGGQYRCMCTGSNCNSADKTVVGSTIMALALAVKYIV